MVEQTQNVPVVRFRVSESVVEQTQNVPVPRFSQNAVEQIQHVPMPQKMKDITEAAKIMQATVWWKGPSDCRSQGGQRACDAASHDRVAAAAVEQVQTVPASQM